MFILTGSQNFSLMANVTESLAGRAGILQLPVFSVSESPSGKEHILKKCLETIFKGFYPDCYLENVERSFFYSSYIQTYIERDVRQIINISDLSLFHSFITLVASRLGSILNLNEIAREAGVSFNSVKKWLSVLQDQDMILTNSLISLTLKEGETLGVNPELDGVERGSVDRIINPAVPHKNKIVKDQYNVMLLKFKNQYNIEFRAYDDGIAYRIDDPSWIRPGKVAWDWWNNLNVTGVDFHGSYKPAGLQRTYPNVITREGVRGLEWCKWSDVVGPEHDVTIPFIRMVAGPMDYTPGAMDNAGKVNFNSRFSRPMSQGTRAHQMAMYVVFESPLQMLADNPGIYMNNLECTNFITKVPVVWYESHVLHAKVGDYVVVARKKDDVWYVGGLTDWSARELPLDLSFIGDGEFSIAPKSRWI